ncbi:archaemetzincin family Zn-dependent metalloprotease [Candidatus Bathyarchaeota archaeon]|nr:archaemetzincin family Zn-dependent metalloprotease [Candidatus Bathyarchaeota archaeon]
MVGTGPQHLRVLILQIGELPPKVLESITNGLSSVFKNIKFEPMAMRFPLPWEAFDALRKQFDSSKILSKISKLSIKEDYRILGVTGIDLYVQGMNFVFGQAQLGGRSALISIYRLKPEFYGSKPNESLLLERCVKEAIHEFGHTLGLRHCPNPRCVMTFSNNILMVDAKSREFCQRCHRIALETMDFISRI